MPAAGTPLGPPVHQVEVEGQSGLHPVGGAGTGERSLVTAGGRLRARFR